MNYVLKKEVFSKFVNSVLKEKGIDFIAPVKSEQNDIIKFQKLISFSDLCLDKNAYYPLKEWFFKKNEVLFEFKGDKITIPEKKPKPKIFFGVRRCDLNSINRQDVAFSEGCWDPYYFLEREASTLIGYHCFEKEDNYCFCGSVGLEDHYDLMFYDRGDYFLVEIGSKKGAWFLKQRIRFFKKTTERLSARKKVIKNANRLQKKNIAPFYDHKNWKKGVDLCLGCTSCNTLCPSCYCFEFKDKVNISNLKNGKRIREWSACQLKDFSEVAGNHIFRSDREHRFKHRIYHQLQYFNEKHGKHLCSGCGRCIRGCPTRIDFVGILNNMKTKKPNVKKPKK